MKKFPELISEDETLKQKVVVCNDMEKEETSHAYIGLAKEADMELKEDNFEKKKRVLA